MIHRFVVDTMWIAASCVVVAGTWRYRDTMRHVWSAESRASGETLVNIRAGPSTDSLHDAATRAFHANVFRWDRSPADPGAQTVAMAGAQVASAPMLAPLSLRGLLGGPPWTVVLQGLPGTPTAVVLRMGDTVAGFSVVRIAHDTVMVSGLGNVYTLTLRPDE